MMINTMLVQQQLCFSLFYSTANTPIRDQLQLREDEDEKRMEILTLKRKNTSRVLARGVLSNTKQLKLFVLSAYQHQVKKISNTSPYKSYNIPPSLPQQTTTPQSDPAPVTHPLH